MATQGILSTISRRTILATGIGLIVILIGVTAIVLALLRSETLQRAEQHHENLARALSQQTWQAVRSIELLMRTTAEDLIGRDAKDHVTPDARMIERLRERMAMLPSARVVTYLDAQGNAILHSDAFPTPALNYADREYFRAHVARRIDGVHVGVPVVGRLRGEWLNPVSLRLEDRDSRFSGLLAAGVQVQHFQGMFGAFRLGESGRVHMFREDGVLLATHPPADKLLGRSFAGDRLFARELADGARVERRTGLLDAELRVVAFERVTGYPIVVVLSSTEDYLLQEWRRGAWRIGAGAAAAAAFIGLALFFLLRQARVSAGLGHELETVGGRLNGIIQSAMDPIITVDARQMIVLFNAAAEKTFHCAAAEAVGGPLERFIPTRFRDAHRHHIERFGETGTTTRMMGTRLALSGLRADGTEFPIDASISQLGGGDDKFYTVILRDVTERRRAEDELHRSHEELRELSAAMHEVREAERMRVARELHDELAQWLTALKMDIAWLASRLPPEPAQLAARTERMKGVVDTTVAAVRRIAADLRPVMLDDLGLVPALENLLHDLSERTGLVVSLDADESGQELGEPLASSLYRMAQEALTNVARHAGATEVDVALVLDGDKLALTVRDNGRGYDADAAAKRKSYGVLGIRERARTLGGDARIERLATGGTQVEIVIPLARYRRRENPNDTSAAR